MTCWNEVYRTVLKELIRKSGVREWEDEGQLAAIKAAAIELANAVEECEMPYFKTTTGTAKTIKNSGGDAAITLASLANGNGTSTGARQAVTLDLGANWARLWKLVPNYEFAATPTAGNAVNHWASWSDTTGAGRGNTSGTDAAYTGYNNNIEAAAKSGLEFLGAHICTSQATTTVQTGVPLVFMPKGRYLNLVVENRSGAAFHSTDTNQVITLTPLEEFTQAAA